MSWPHIYFQPFPVWYLVLHLCREQHCSWWSHYLHKQNQWPMLGPHVSQSSIKPRWTVLFLKHFPILPYMTQTASWFHSKFCSFPSNLRHVSWWYIQTLSLHPYIISESLESVNINTKWRVRPWVGESCWPHTYLGSTTGSFCDLGTFLDFFYLRFFIHIIRITGL